MLLLDIKKGEEKTSEIKNKGTTDERQSLYESVVSFIVISKMMMVLL